jgi:hypothetical protein
VAGVVRYARKGREVTEPNTDGDEFAGVADLLEGTAHDGPLDGGTMTSRRPAGVILVDRPAGRCWLYDWRDGAFYCRETEGRPLERDPAGGDNLERAAEEGEWDVQAAPWIGGDPNDVDPDDPDADQVPLDTGVEIDQPGQLGHEVTGPIDETEV